MNNFLPHPSLRPVRSRSVIALMTLFTAALLGVACSGQSQTQTPACTGTVRSEANAGNNKVLLLLTPGLSPAVSAAAKSIASNPEEIFSSSNLGFTENKEAADPTDESSVVVLATYDSLGAVSTQGTFDLSGVGNDPSVRKLSARSQGDCLMKAVESLTTPAGQGGDLLRSMERASAVAADQAQGGPASVIAVGLGVSTIDNRKVADLDLSTSGQEAVLGELDRVGLVPDLADSAISIQFLDPAAGVENSVSASGVEAFAESLCAKIGAITCSSGPTLK
jgi:hypothetical protein